MKPHSLDSFWGFREHGEDASPVATESAKMDSTTG